MGASVKAQILSGDPAGEGSNLDLKQAIFSRGSQETLFNLDDWPLLVFLKGFGCERIEFSTRQAEIIERWSERLLTYEQIYLADPDSLKIHECHWDEVDPITNTAWIRCHFALLEPQKEKIKTLSVPPMEAPLGISEMAKANLIREIETEGTQETLARFVSILQEYRQNAVAKDPIVWALLVGDIISLCLSHRQLERAVQLHDEHRASLPPFWNDPERVSQLLAAMDPKAAELKTWLRVFDSLPTDRLLSYLETHLGGPAGPPLLKLVGSRVHSHTEEFIDICFRSEPMLQKLLLQWLQPFWKPVHFGRILNSLQSHIQSSPSDELLRLWIQALLRASPSNALDQLFTFFKPRIPFWRGGSRGSRVRRLIINVLAENPSSEAYEFLKRIRKHLEGELADQVERLLHHHREVPS